MRWVRCPGSGHSPPAGFSDGLFSLTGADPFSGFHRFSPFHFLSLSGKEISAYGRGGIGSSRRLLFQRSSVPPRSPLHYQLENGGAKTRGKGPTDGGHTRTEKRSTRRSTRSSDQRDRFRSTRICVLAFLHFDCSTSRLTDSEGCALERTRSLSLVAYP